MHEYLIRTVESHHWPAFHATSMAEVFMPVGFNCSQVDGWGDFRMTWGDAVIAFSGEEVGWLVTVEASNEIDSDGLIEAVTANVGAAAGERCEWLRLT